MSSVNVRLYMLAVSHPARAAQRMLEYKGVPHGRVYLLPGLHPALLRLAGFRGGTVPALDMGDNKVQGSRSISRALDEAIPEPPLFPADPEQRVSVEEAERWGEEDLQEVLRRIFRWSTAHQQRVRRWLGELSGVPAPGLVGALNAPLARGFAKLSRADEGRVVGDIAHLPHMLDHVDSLIESGVIASSAPNAADFQIGSSVRVLMAFSQLRPMAERRPAGELALRLYPSYPEPIPASLPIPSAD
jgi:glutathione S-transferase